MGALLRVGLVLVMLTLWAVGSSQAQDGLTKQDRQGPVSVSVTLRAAPAIGAPLNAKVVLDTHSVALDGIKFEEAVALRMPDGTDITPAAVEQATGSGHHREAVLVFPPLEPPENVRIVVKNVGGVAERSFSWELPPAR
jgi:hypothetical protein